MKGENKMSYVSRLAQLVRDLKKVQLIDRFGESDRILICWGYYFSTWSWKKEECKFSIEIIFLREDYEFSTDTKCNVKKNLAPHIINAFREEFSECEIDVEIAPDNSFLQGVLIIVR